MSKNICDTVKDDSVPASGIQPPASIMNFFQSSLVQKFVVTDKGHGTDTSRQAESSMETAHCLKMNLSKGFTGESQVHVS